MGDTAQGISQPNFESHEDSVSCLLDLAQDLLLVFNVLQIASAGKNVGLHKLPVHESLQLMTNCGVFIIREIGGWGLGSRV